MRALFSLAALVLGVGVGLAQERPGPVAATGRTPATTSPGAEQTLVGGQWLAPQGAPPRDALFGIGFPTQEKPGVRTAVGTTAPGPAVGQGRPGDVRQAAVDAFVRDDLLEPDDVGDGSGSGRPAGRFWVRGEYLLWWTRGGSSPPLVTTGVPGLAPLPGALGQAGTSVLYGGSDDDSRPRAGGRFTAGVWLDPCRTVGVDASYFFLGNRTTRFDAASDARLGSLLIARPFFDVLTGAQNAQLVAFPLLANGTNILTVTGAGVAAGDIHASAYSRLQGADVNVLCGGISGCNYWVQALAGFRYLNLEEGIAVTENSRVNPALPAAAPFFGGSSIAIGDRFDTRNHFYGGQVGLRGELRSGRLFVEAQGKLAMGVTHEVVDIGGTTAITSPDGTTATTPVGFLASGSNSGHFARDRFAVVPEVGVNAGVLVTPNVRAFVGYTFLYWSAVARPGDQIDTGLSGTQIPTDTRYDPTAPPARPAAALRDTGFWVQGVSFGLEFRH